MFDLLEAIAKGGDYSIFWFILGGHMSADANDTPEKEAACDTQLKEILSALDSFENPPDEFIRGKEKIAGYLEKRVKGEIGG